MKSKSCYVCGQENLSRNEIGLNKKLINRKIKLFYCINCLADYLEIEVEFLLENIEEFKEQGCILF
ncbi:MAG: hypothetical protein M0P77_08085 [Firmicutes bacterium]|nr:hypothetical protein [Bacillota bacterium]